MKNVKTELLKIANKVIVDNELDNIEIQFKQVDRGRARADTRKITIPIWAICGERAFGIYYVIHEITHFITYNKFGFDGRHCELFKKIETAILKKYNIKPVYSKAYPKYLEDLNGNLLCNKYGEN